MLFRKQKRTEIRELNLRISDDAIQSVNDFNFLGLHINSGTHMLIDIMFLVIEINHFYSYS